MNRSWDQLVFNFNLRHIDLRPLKIKINLSDNE
jgi:hypothetical protein